MLEDLSQVRKLSKHYKIPQEDIILIALNCSGIKANLKESRIRFKLKLNSYHKLFYLGVCVNTRESPFFLRSDKLYLNNSIIGTIIERENDTCDSTYFRRNKTALTLNSNSRSRCNGCKFCGTYNLDAADINNLTTKKRLSDYFEKFMFKNHLQNLSTLVDIGICTGCFPDEEKTLKHILMVRKVLREFEFKKELKYLGSQIRSKRSFNILKKNAMPFSLYMTLEVFKNRKKWLRPLKAQVTLKLAKEILRNAKNSGFNTTFLYILGIEPLKLVFEQLPVIQPFITRFPLINVFQNYNPSHENYRVPEAKNIEYYLECRKRIEDLFRKTNLRPRPWENYRSLWYTKFSNEEVDEFKI